MVKSEPMDDASSARPPLNGTDEDVPTTISNFRANYMMMRRHLENPTPKVPITQAVIDAYAAGGTARHSLFVKFVVNNNDLQKISFEVLKAVLGWDGYSYMICV